MFKVNTLILPQHHVANVNSNWTNGLAKIRTNYFSALPVNEATVKFQSCNIPGLIFPNSPKSYCMVNGYPAPAEPGVVAPPPDPPVAADVEPAANPNSEAIQKLLEELRALFNTY